MRAAENPLIERAEPIATADRARARAPSFPGRAFPALMPAPGRDYEPAGA